MKPESPKTLRQMLIRERRSRDEIFYMLRERTRLLKVLANNDTESFLFRLALVVEKQVAIEGLLTTLIYKRRLLNDQEPAKSEKRFTPYERSAIPVTDELPRRIFKFN